MLAGMLLRCPVGCNFLWTIARDRVPLERDSLKRRDGPTTAAAAASAVTGPWAACLQGEIVEGFNFVLYEGGSVGDLEACADGAGFAALYVLDDGVWVSYILSAPEFVNRPFRELFTDGLPVATPLSRSAVSGGAQRSQSLTESLPR